MAMTQAQTALVLRLRERLAGVGAVREVPMFGGRAFMVDGRMAVSAQKDGSLLAHVDRGRHDALLEEPGASQAQMGAGRTMGAGWISVAAAAIEGDEPLRRWLEEALARV